MRAQRSGSGLKRQVSATWAVVTVVAVIAVACLIGLGGPVWRNLTTRTITSHDLGRPGEVSGPSDIMRVSQERLGVLIGRVPDYKGGGGLPVLGAMPGVSSALQVGDVIAAINGAKVTSMKTIAEETAKVAVGQKLAVDIRRAGRPMTLQVIRRESAQSAGGALGGMTSRPARMPAGR